MEKKKKLLFDYKDPLSLYPFIDGGKIVPARNSGLTSKQQRELKHAIKKARNLGLIPTDFKSYDDFGRPALISPRPFDYK